jgi:transposase
MNDNSRPISIACSECTNQIERTYESLRDNETLTCPVCDHQMAAERAAIIQHIETIRNTIAAIAK